MSRVEFFEPMRIPSTTHNDLEPCSRRGKPAIRKSGKLKAAEATWEAHLARHVPPRPLEGALAVEVAYCYEPDATHPPGTPKDTPPDGDNLDKTVRDVMQRLKFFENDGQIAEGRTVKGYQHPEGIYVKIDEIGG